MKDAVMQRSSGRPHWQPLDTELKMGSYLEQDTERFAPIKETTWQQALKP